MPSGTSQFNELKQEAKSFGKNLFIDFALEFYRADILAKIADLLQPYSTVEVTNRIQQGVLLQPSEELYSFLKGYKSAVEEYSIKDLGKVLFDWISEARPDVAGAMISLGDAGAEWLAAESELIRNSVLHPELKQEVQDPKVEFSQATCESCGQSWLVEKEKVESMTRCPFCGEEQGVTRETKAKLEKEAGTEKKSPDSNKHAKGGSHGKGKEQAGS